MTTEQALDLAYDNPYVCITTESLYEYGEKFFYYDKDGNLKDYNGNVITEDKIYKHLPEAVNEDFDEWIEIEAEIPEEKYEEDSYNSMYDGYEE